MSSFYNLALLSIISICFVRCSEGKLTTPSALSVVTTTTTVTTTTISYGACERTEETSFSIENCKNPSTCHVKDLGDGICRPSCGYLAQISEEGKYHGYGPDEEPSTEDDPHSLTSSVSCEELDKWGATDWKKVPLIDDIEPWEVKQALEDDSTASECCGSDQQVEKNNQAQEEEEGV